jgi:ATP-dependent helicase HrpA
VTRRLTYHGFELERDEEEVDEFPEGREQEARRALAMALAKGEARHPAVRRNRRVIDETRELYRRSGGKTPRLTLADLAARYEELLARVHSTEAYRSSPLKLDLWGLITPEERQRLLDLPSAVEIRDKWIDVDYDIEERSATSDPRSGSSPDSRGIAVARLRLPEKLARSLVEQELPVLDRPLRFVVTRGPRGTVRAASLGELQSLLDRPWSPDEVFEDRRPRKRDERPRRHEERRQFARGRRGDRRRRRR